MIGYLTKSLINHRCFTMCMKVLRRCSMDSIVPSLLTDKLDLARPIPCLARASTSNREVPECRTLIASCHRKEAKWLLSQTSTILLNVASSQGASLTFSTKSHMTKLRFQFIAVSFKSTTKSYSTFSKTQTKKTHCKSERTNCKAFT